MSGIYGFTYRHANDDTLENALCGLRWWTQNYGREAHGDELLGNSGIGCFVEHFSEKFSSGGPILNHLGNPAVADALLYNRDELTCTLGLPSDCTVSDEELLLRLIAEKGFEALAMVNGDFAGAIYDRTCETWILFRDHMGVRPLHYYLDDNIFGFSTDLIAVCSLPETDLKPDELMLYRNLIGANRITLQGTDFANIRCALPGAVTRIHKTDSTFQITEERYWQLQSKKIRYASHEEYCAELRRLVTDAVHRRCDAIPGILGAELSGGLDSGVIDILIARYGRDCRFYSWSHPPELLPIVDSRDERNNILEICSREGIECRFRVPADNIPLTQRGAAMVPPYTASPVLSHGSAWLHSQGARVVFSGHGGDEGISHRGQRFELFFNREYWTYFKYYWMDFRGKPLRLLRTIRTGLLEAREGYRKIRSAMEYVPEHCYFIRPSFVDRIRAEYTPKIRSFSFAPDIYVQQGGSRHRMDNVAYQGALNGVRYLLPYLDYRVMDFALSIPRREFVGHNLNRRVFRDAFRDILPERMYGEVMKRNVSYDQIPDAPNKAENHRKLVELLVSQLDPELWDPYMDLAQLTEVLCSSGGESGGFASVSDLMTYIVRCKNIQNLNKHAKDWRNYEAKSKTL